MKNGQDIVGLAVKATEVVVDAINFQIKKIVRLLSKEPKKPPLSWESIIGSCFPEAPHKHVVAHSRVDAALPEVNQQLAQLEPEIFEELLRRIQKNAIDEIQMIRMYEKLCACEIQILRGHVHFYKSTSGQTTETIDYTTLMNRLIQQFEDHKKLVARRSSLAQ